MIVGMTMDFTLCCDDISAVVWRIIFDVAAAVREATDISLIHFFIVCGTKLTVQSCKVDYRSRPDFQHYFFVR